MGISQDKKMEVVELMVGGENWQRACERVGVKTSRTSAYRWVRIWREQGREGLSDGRQGHASKMKPEVKGWLKERCEGAPQTASSQLSGELQAEFGVDVSRGHLNLVRRELGVARPKKNKS